MHICDGGGRPAATERQDGHCLTVLTPEIGPGGADNVCASSNPPTSMGSPFTTEVAVQQGPESCNPPIYRPAAGPPGQAGEIVCWSPKAQSSAELGACHHVRYGSIRQISTIPLQGNFFMVRWRVQEGLYMTYKLSHCLYFGLKVAGAVREDRCDRTDWSATETS